MPDISVSSTLRRFLRYPISGRIMLLYPAGYRIFLKFRHSYGSGKLRRADSVKTKFTFSIYVEKFDALYVGSIVFYIEVDLNLVNKFFFFGAARFVVRKATSMV